MDWFLKGTLTYPGTYAGAASPVAMWAHQYPATRDSYAPLVADLLGPPSRSTSGGLALPVAGRFQCDRYPFPGGFFRSSGQPHRLEPRSSE
jgi:hypothetical protein